MVHLVVGYGEVGKAIGKVIGKHVWRSASEKGTWDGKEVDVAHICVPYKTGEIFFNTINTYRHYAKLVIVHSTVPLGTCDNLQVVHSPIRGIHPELAKGIKTFVKYFGGKNSKKAAKIFKDLGIKTKVYPEAKTTEALKLWDTTQYGILIILEKGIHKWCKDNGVDFEEVYRNANKDYNEGYVKLGRPDVVRPFLRHMPGPIRGHCIIPNSKMLGKNFEIPEDLEDLE